MRDPRPSRPWNWRRDVILPLMAVFALAVLAWAIWPSDVEIEPVESGRVVEEANELKRKRLRQAGFSEEAAERIIRRDEKS